MRLEEVSEAGRSLVMIDEFGLVALRKREVRFGTFG